MKKWESFELYCTNYLNENFGEYATFTHQGGADSTVPDIYVKTKNGNAFYIEAKHSPAQCGQFVLLPNIQNCCFEYSVKNKTSVNTYSNTIKEYMEKFFDEYREADTKGKDIIFENCSEIFAKWIIQNYKANEVKYIITNDFMIIPVEDILDYFEISSKYRIKRSGSGNAGKEFIANFDKILNTDNFSKFMILSIRTKDSKLFVKSSIDLHNKRFIYKNHEYMFSQRDSEFEVRKLSNTYNANVIFSIKLRKNKSGISNESFKSLLNC